MSNTESSSLLSQVAERLALSGYASSVDLDGLEGVELVQHAINRLRQMGCYAHVRPLEYLKRTLTHTTVLKLSNFRCTVYVLGAFGVKRVECRSVKVERGPYAQHANATSVTFVEKGKRTPRGYVDHDLFCVVVAGHGHVAPPSAFEPARISNGLEVSSSRYSSCDPRWQSDFLTAFDAYVSESGASVLFDSRSGS